jgi:hypothetical protein
MRSPQIRRSRQVTHVEQPVHPLPCGVRGPGGGVRGPARLLSERAWGCRMVLMDKHWRVVLSRSVAERYWEEARRGGLGEVRVGTRPLPRRSPVPTRPDTRTAECMLCQVPPVIKVPKYTLVPVQRDGLVFLAVLTAEGTHVHMHTHTQKAPASTLSRTRISTKTSACTRTHTREPRRCHALTVPVGGRGRGDGPQWRRCW